MLRYAPHLLLSLFALSACQPDTVTTPDVVNAELQKKVDERILDLVEETGEPFDWNRQSDDFLCESLPLTNYQFVVGYEQNESAREMLGEFISNYADVTLLRTDRKLGICYLRAENCERLSAIRKMNGIEYIELDHFPADISRWIGNALPSETPLLTRVEQRAGNPGSYVPGSMPYLQYLSGIDGGAANHAYLENLDEVYHEMGYYGSAGCGVAVVDNGVREEEVDYFSVGPGGYDMDGYFIRNLGNPNAVPDGPHPLPTDIYGLWALIEPSFNHGTSMTDNIYSLAPFAHRMTVRASPTYILITANQKYALTNAITALADDPDIKIISMSMGGPFYMNTVRSAIRYFNSKNKIFLSAGGSSLPILKDILGILFPARLPETVSVTGIDALDETGGVWQLGFYAHGGPQNDFIIEDASSSSTATSNFAGMLSVLWGINPGLDRETVIQFLTDHSTYFLQQGAKHPKFGWGKVDMYQAALDIEGTL